MAINPEKNTGGVVEEEKSQKEILEQALAEGSVGPMEVELRLAVRNFEILGQENEEVTPEMIVERAQAIKELQTKNIEALNNKEEVKFGYGYRSISRELDILFRNLWEVCDSPVVEIAETEADHWKTINHPYNANIGHSAKQIAKMREENEAKNSDREFCGIKILADGSSLYDHIDYEPTYPKHNRWQQDVLSASETSDLLNDVISRAEEKEKEIADRKARVNELLDQVTPLPGTRFSAN